MAANKETKVCALLMVLIATGCLGILFQLAILTETVGEGKGYSGNFSHQQLNAPTGKGIMLLSPTATWPELVKSTHQPERNKIKFYHVSRREDNRISAK